MILDALNYTRSRAQTFGLKEHYDAFNSLNIPSTVLEDSFFVLMDEAQGISNNQSDQVVEQPLTLQIYLSPRLDTLTQRDNAYSIAQNVIVDLIKSSNRLEYSQYLKDFRFTGLNVGPLNDTNDNGVLIEIKFTALIIFSAETCGNL